MSSPRPFSAAAKAATRLDFPEAGSPVTHTAKASRFLPFTVGACLPGIKRLFLQYRNNKSQKFLAYTVRQSRIPHGTGHDQSPEGEEGCHDSQHFMISTRFQVTLPEAEKQRLQPSLQAFAALKGEKQIIRRQTCDIVRGVSPLTARTVQ